VSFEVGQFEDGDVATLEEYMPFGDAAKYKKFKKRQRLSNVTVLVAWQNHLFHSPFHVILNLFQDLPELDSGSSPE
jgi:hypothetical protein